MEPNLQNIQQNWVLYSKSSIEMTHYSHDKEFYAIILVWTP